MKLWCNNQNMMGCHSLWEKLVVPFYFINLRLLAYLVSSLISPLASLLFGAAVSNLNFLYVSQLSYGTKTSWRYVTSSVFVSTGCLLGPGPNLWEVSSWLLQSWPGETEIQTSINDELIMTEYDFMWHCCYKSCTVIHADLLSRLAQTGMQFCFCRRRNSVVISCWRNRGGFVRPILLCVIYSPSYMNELCCVITFVVWLLSSIICLCCHSSEHNI